MPAPEAPGSAAAEAVAEATPDASDVPVYFPCADCMRPVPMRQARAVFALRATILCADCLSR